MYESYQQQKPNFYAGNDVKLKGEQIGIIITKFMSVRSHPIGI